MRFVLIPKLQMITAAGIIADLLLIFKNIHLHNKYALPLIAGCLFYLKYKPILFVILSLFAL